MSHHRSPIAPVIAVLALLAAMVIGPASPSAATSSDPCLTSFAIPGEVRVPWRSGPYVGAGEHWTDCYMKPGVTGDGVRVLQRALRNCYGENITVDGSFGPATGSALRRVQSRLGIASDGLYGNQTRDAMKFYLYTRVNEHICKPEPYYPSRDV